MNYLKSSMWTIKYTSKFKSDYKREQKGRHGKKLERLLKPVINLLAEDQVLPKNLVDQPIERPMEGLS